MFLPTFLLNLLSLSTNFKSACLLRNLGNMQNFWFSLLFSLIHPSALSYVPTFPQCSSHNWRCSGFQALQFTQIANGSYVFSAVQNEYSDCTFNSLNSDSLEQILRSSLPLIISVFSHIILLLSSYFFRAY